MKHKDFKEQLKRSESGFFLNSLMMVMFLWVTLLAAFIARSWMIVFLMSGIITIWMMASTTIITKTYEGYLFMSYLFDDVLDRIKKMEKKK